MVSHLDGSHGWSAIDYIGPEYEIYKATIKHLRQCCILGKWFWIASHKNIVTVAGQLNSAVDDIAGQICQTEDDPPHDWVIPDSTVSVLHHGRVVHNDLMERVMHHHDNGILEQYL